MGSDSWVPTLGLALRRLTSRGTSSTDISGVRSRPVLGAYEGQSSDICTATVVWASPGNSGVAGEVDSQLVGWYEFQVPIAWATRESCLAPFRLRPYRHFSNTIRPDSSRLGASVACAGASVVSVQQGKCVADIGLCPTTSAIPVCGWHV